MLVKKRLATASREHARGSVSRYDVINDVVRDERLIARLREHDEAAFDRLFRLCYSALADVARRYTTSADDAEDIAADVLVWMWERRAAVDIQGPVTAYLFRAVRNRALSVRASRRTVSTDPDVSDDTEMARAPVATSHDPQLALEAAEVSTHVRRAVDALPPRAREVFLLSRRDGLSIREVAGVLGVTPSTVQTQLARVLHVLKSAVGLTK